MSNTTDRDGTPMLQPFAAVFLVDPDSKLISHASTQCSAILGHEALAMLGANAHELLGRETWHAMRNAASHPDFASSAVPFTLDTEDGRSLELRVSISDQSHLVEVEAPQASEFGGTSPLAVAKMAMTQLRPAVSEPAFAAGLADLIRHFSGFDRVVIWRARGTGDARTISEAKRRSAPSVSEEMVPWDALWPTPGNASRDTPTLTLVGDAAAAPQTLHAHDLSIPNPNTQLALSHPPEPNLLHRLSLYSMSAAFQLRLTCNGLPWGVVEAHSAMVRRPSPVLRSLMEALLPFIDVKLQSLQSPLMRGLEMP